MNCHPEQSAAQSKDDSEPLYVCPSEPLYVCPSEPLYVCHSEPLYVCHSERSEESPYFALVVAAFWFSRRLEVGPDCDLSMD
jgi:hypothetical protein